MAQKIGQNASYKKMRQKMQVIKKWDKYACPAAIMNDVDRYLESRDHSFSQGHFFSVQHLFSSNSPRLTWAITKEAQAIKFLQTKIHYSRRGTKKMQVIEKKSNKVLKNWRSGAKPRTSLDYYQQDSAGKPLKPKPLKK